MPEETVLQSPLKSGRVSICAGQCHCGAEIGATGRES